MHAPISISWTHSASALLAFDTREMNRDFQLQWPDLNAAPGMGSFDNAFEDAHA